MDFFDNLEQESEADKKWISVPSELASIDGTHKEIKIELMSDGKPRAMAFFDIDGTLAHLNAIHGKAIHALFPEQEPVELEKTYYAGFRLGNSFREFDRMRGIYVGGHAEWKDPEVYLKERFNPHAKEIDEAGNLDHNIAADILKAYGEIAAKITEDLYKQNPEEFSNSNIAPIFTLARMYTRLGIPMVGFTANAKVFVEKLAKYLKLSDIFLNIATDETMVGGGKEIAIAHLISEMESKGISVPKGRLIFVGDSLRGDIGMSLLAHKKDSQIFGQGILVLKDRQALVETERQISADSKLREMADKVNITAIIIDDVPLDDKGSPILLSRFKDKFLQKL